MPSKITSSVKGLVKEPLATLKAGVSQAQKPADISKTSLVFIGALASPVAGFLYNKGFELLWKKIPKDYKVFNYPMVIRVLLPLIPIYFVRKFKIKFGTLIVGTLAGVAVYSFISALFNKYMGKSWQDLFVPKAENPQTTIVNGSHLLFAEW